MDSASNGCHAGSYECHYPHEDGQGVSSPAITEDALFHRCFDHSYIMRSRQPLLWSPYRAI